VRYYCGAILKQCDIIQPELAPIWKKKKNCCWFQSLRNATQSNAPQQQHKARIDGIISLRVL